MAHQPPQSALQLSPGLSGQSVSGQGAATAALPVCLFAAPDDALFTPALTNSVFALLEAPTKKLVWLPGGGHLAAMQPKTCTFLARTRRPFAPAKGLPLRLSAGEEMLAEAAWPR